MNLIECGKILGTHGIKGEVKVDAWCDDPEFLLDFNELYLSNTDKLEIKSARMHKNRPLMLFKGYGDIDAAEQLINKILYFDRDEIELQDGTFFIADLIGVSVFDADTGELYGSIVQVLQNGGRDVYLMKNEAGRELMFPAIPEVVISTDISEKKMLIRPLKGLFDL